MKGSFLSPADKVRLVAEAEHDIAAGVLDATMIPFVRRLNAIPWLATTQCCQGHLAGENQYPAEILAYISLRCDAEHFATFLGVLWEYERWLCDASMPTGWIEFDVERRHDESLYWRAVIWWQGPEQTTRRMKRLCELAEKAGTTP